MRRKVLLTILILAVLLGLMPTAVFAAGTSKAVKLKLSAKSCKAGESITVSSDSGFSRIYIEWEGIPGAWTLKTDVTEIQCGQNGFQHEYVELPEDVKTVQFVMPKGGKIHNVTAYPNDGLALPSSVQIWEPQPERVDVLVFATHPDDDTLFLSGAIITLAAEKGWTVEVVHIMGYRNVTPIREHERLNGIWTMGVKQYPVAGVFDAVYKQGYKYYNGKILSEPHVDEYITEVIRHFKPQIVITHDLNGEYGHPRHKLVASMVTKAVSNSMKEDYYPASAEKYGTWDVPKTYLHLYKQDTIVLDLRHPIDALGGKTAVATAKEAYLKHESQLHFGAYVTDDPKDPRSYKYNISYFGLYRTTVGKDSGNDMTEHIISYAEQERIAAEKAALYEARLNEELARISEEEKRFTEEQKAFAQARKQKAEEDARIAAQLLATQTNNRNAMITIGGSACLMMLLFAITKLTGKKKTGTKR